MLTSQLVELTIFLTISSWWSKESTPSPKSPTTVEPTPSSATVLQEKIRNEELLRIIFNGVPD